MDVSGDLKTEFKSAIAALALTCSAAAAQANTIIDIAAGDERFSALAAASTPARR